MPFSFVVRLYVGVHDRRYTEQDLTKKTQIHPRDRREASVKFEENRSDTAYTNTLYDTYAGSTGDILANAVWNAIYSTSLWLGWHCPVQ